MSAQTTFLRLAENPKLLDDLEADVYNLKDALRTIAGPEDQGHWIEVYRAAGGGYEGLQAIAREALKFVEDR